MTQREWYAVGMGWMAAYTMHWIIDPNPFGIVVCGSFLLFYFWRWRHC